MSLAKRPAAPQTPTPTPDPGHPAAPGSGEGAQTALEALIRKRKLRTDGTDAPGETPAVPDA